MMFKNRLTVNFAGEVFEETPKTGLAWGQQPWHPPTLADLFPSGNGTDSISSIPYRQIQYYFSKFHFLSGKHTNQYISVLWCKTLQAGTFDRR
jgi:hypothetical protein